MSSFFAGAEMITFFTLPRRCLRAPSASVNLPVDSTTICAPTDSQFRLAGSFSAKTLILLLPILMVFSLACISSLRLPRTESYFSKCASVFASVRSLTATNSIFGLLSAVRTTFLPIRPNPLIPTLIAINSPCARCRSSSNTIDCGMKGRDQLML